MGIKKMNPTSPGVRGTVLISRESLYKGKPFKPLVVGLSKKSGRNHHGRVTCRHKGGGHKRSFRLVDFKRNKKNVYAVVDRIEYDPNRSSFIALITYEDGVKSYILAPKGLSAGNKVISADKVEIEVGNCALLENLPVGINIHNIEIKTGKGAQLVRSAGLSAQILGKEGGYAQIRMPSGEIRLIDIFCRATIGILSNADNFNVKLGKAGRSRWLGKRPSVRGVAMNPHDHPHGCGGAKTSGGIPLTPWGKKAIGRRTRHKSKTNKFIVKRRYRK